MSADRVNLPTPDGSLFGETHSLASGLISFVLTKPTPMVALVRALTSLSRKLLRTPPPLSTTLGSSLGLKPTPTWSLASPLREQMPACSSTPMLNAAALRTLFVPLAHGPLRLPKRDAGAP